MNPINGVKTIATQIEKKNILTENEDEKIGNTGNV